MEKTEPTLNGTIERLLKFCDQLDEIELDMILLNAALRDISTSIDKTRESLDKLIVNLAINDLEA